MNNQEAHDLLMKLPEFTKEFLSESDRSAVIFSSSLIDDLLSRILRAFFLEGNISKDLIYGGTAPLGTFSSRIKSSYALGLICKNEYNDLNKIRKLRNIFAHEWGDINLGNDNMTQICRSMYNIRTDIPAKKQKPRDCFNTVIGILFTQLSHRALITKNQDEYSNY